MSGGRQLELQWSEHQGRSCLRVLGWTEPELRELGQLPVLELSRRLRVLPTEVVQTGGELGAVQPTAGSWEIDQDSVCFIPRFPFRDGMGYALLIDSGQKEKGADNPAVWTIQRTSPRATPTTEVVAIYPTTAQLPVNLLKFYVHFSAPMSEDWATRSIHIRRADNGQVLEDVFVPMEPELWDPERRRLTILLDPGRIKRGLVPNAEAGYPLMEGVPIIFSIDAKFRDATGTPLQVGVERRYEIGPVLRQRIDPAHWRCHFPLIGSRDPLTLEFDRPLDHGLLQHCLRVNNQAGKSLVGRVIVGPEESCWQFEPQLPWGEGGYQLVVDPRLEDVAGNSPVRVFDRDLNNVEDDPASGEHFAIDFTCAQAPERYPRS